MMVRELASLHLSMSSTGNDPLVYPVDFHGKRWKPWQLRCLMPLTHLSNIQVTFISPNLPFFLSPIIIIHLSKYMIDESKSKAITPKHP